MKCHKLILLFIAFITTVAAKSQEISLNGQWSFALDPLARGEVMGWNQPWKINEKDSSNGYAADRFDKVIVPHCWSTDIRYNFVGKAWYRKAFKLPADAKDQLIRIRFEAVFYKCRIFINGELAAYHAGGYTPFTVNITKFIKYSELNFIAVEVDNSWTELTVPGARMGDHPSAQFFPWYEYGGITRDVSLLITDKIYIKNQKIESIPDLKTGKAQVKIITWVENRSLSDAAITIKPTISNRTSGSKIESGNALVKSINIKAFTTEKIIQQYELLSAEVLLWDFDNPNLYDVTTAIESGNKRINQYETYFGIREFKVAGTQLLLNGNPVRLAGSNRHSDHPVYGSTEPAELAKIDMELQRNGHMIFARMNHTPVSKHFYRWADEHGYLLVAETPNWQISPVLMATQNVKDDFESQLKEMVEACWNSPSVVAYSTGNEYASWTPEGDEWTREQFEQYRLLDTTRLLTFVAIGTAVNPVNLKLPHDAFRYCDFLNFNNYSAIEGLERNINYLHEKYPNKPIFISETGMRSDEVKNEQVRIDHLKGLIDVINRHPYVVGFSYWSYNDYLSRFAGTNKDGYRPWGIVDANRKPRALYKAFQKELSPVTITVQKNKILITAKAGFPSYTISNHVLKLMEGEKLNSSYTVPEIKPGSTVEIILKKAISNSRIVIENKGGIVIFDSSL
ncbi:sugar-binding domain-containing protein [Lacibacter sp. H375]|uniref:glycoside hydrolase family 2 protein n=1 Tax=Lacibacter sp. H375 TaxID=3133424 RepID=UPI0030C2CAB2